MNNRYHGCGCRKSPLVAPAHPLGAMLAAGGSRKAAR